jgi:putative PIN family toxin of toxin-antitoxin system
MRLVLDTNILLSAFLWTGRPAKLFDSIDGKHILLFTSAPLVAELADVLSRPKFARKIAATPFSIGYFLKLYNESSIAVLPDPVPRLAPDPDDDVVIGTALAAKADFIVTGDRTLRSVAQFQGIRIVSVAEALQATVMG